MSAVLEQTLEKTTMTADEFFDSPYSRGFELVRGINSSEGRKL